MSFLLFRCVSNVCVEGTDSRGTGWLFSWFIIINHCNDFYTTCFEMCVWDLFVLSPHYLVLALGVSELTQLSEVMAI